ncbi:glycosyltransferase [Clostridium sp. CTA-19]
MTKLCILADADSIHTQKWLDYFSGLNYDIHLISMRESDYKYSGNVKTYVLKPMYKNKSSYIFLAHKVKKLVKKINPDILHSYYASSYGFFGAVSGVRPFVVSVWGSDVYLFPKSNGIYKKILNYVFNKADVLCSTSYDMAKEIKSYNSEKEIVITPFGVDVNLFSKTSEIFEKESMTIGIAKSLEKIYSIDTLIKALRMVIDRTKDTNIKLKIIGDGSERKNLINLTEQLNLNENVEFVGRVKNTEVPQYINKVDVMCLCSLSESFGVSAIEASACERPVIASNCGGLKEVIKDNETGLLFEPQNENELADKIEYLYKNRCVAKEMGKEGRRVVLDVYDWEENVKTMSDLYERL